MKVILMETVENAGNVGDIIDVKPGFARNYLFPRGMAILATKQALESVRLSIEKLKAQEDKVKLSLEEKAKNLSEIRLIFPMKTTEDNKLFGSITSTDIAEKLSEVLGSEIEKGDLEIPETLKALGEYKISYKLGHGISAEIIVELAKEGDANKKS